MLAAIEEAPGPTLALMFVTPNAYLVDRPMSNLAGGMGVQRKGSQEDSRQKVAGRR